MRRYPPPAIGQAPNGLGLSGAAIVGISAVVVVGALALVMMGGKKGKRR